MTTATKLYECDGWHVIECRDNVPDGRYEVRSPSGLRYGIWDSIDTAIAHLHEASKPVDDTSWLADLVAECEHNTGA